MHVLKEYPDSYFTSVICDPPYGLSEEPDLAEVLRHWLAGDDYAHRGGGFAGKSWDSFVPGPKVWAEVLRVLKPGGTLLAFAGSRTQDLMTTAIRLGGFEVHDALMWLYGSGFPKSMAVDKAIDKRRDDRAEVVEVCGWFAVQRDRAGIKNREIDAAFGTNGMAGHWCSTKTQPAIPTPEQVPQLLQVLGNPEVPTRIQELIWRLNGRKGTPGEGWLSREVVGEKVMTDTSKVKLSVTIAAQDEAAQAIPKRVVQITEPTALARPWKGYGTALKPCFEPVVLAMKPFERVDGYRDTFAKNALRHGVAGVNIDAARTEGGGWPPNVLHDGSGEVLEVVGPTGARVFYHAKATGERDDFNDHPTLKPVEVMRWLARMVRMPGPNRVLDPFAGSGTTGVACALEGLDFVGIEQDAHYAEIARRRLSQVGTAQTVVPTASEASG